MQRTAAVGNSQTVRRMGRRRLKKHARARARRLPGRTSGGDVCGVRVLLTTLVLTRRLRRPSTRWRLMPCDRGVDRRRDAATCPRMSPPRHLRHPQLVSTSPRALLRLALFSRTERVHSHWLAHTHARLIYTYTYTNHNYTRIHTCIIFIPFGSIDILFFIHFFPDFSITYFVFFYSFNASILQIVQP